MVIPMYGAVVLQIPVSTAVDISVGSTRDPGCITFPEQQLRGFMTSVRLCQERKLDPEIWWFFTGTYASAGAVSHVGIYVGGSRMLHCGSPIGYADLTSPYWNSHLYAFGRLATIPE